MNWVRTPYQVLYKKTIYFVSLHYTKSNKIKQIRIIPVLEIFTSAILMSHDNKNRLDFFFVLKICTSTTIIENLLLLCTINTALIINVWCVFSCHCNAALWFLLFSKMLSIVLSKAVHSHCVLDKALSWKPKNAVVTDMTPAIFASNKYIISQWAGGETKATHNDRHKNYNNNIHVVALIWITIATGRMAIWE